jgi:site-specific recombinase XerD
MMRLKDMGLEEEWLSQILGEGTRKHYARGLHYLLEFLELNTSEELKKFAQKEEHFETRVIQFFQWLQDKKGLSSNSARSNIIPVQSFFSYIGYPLKLKHKLPKLHMKIENWKPSIEDLQKIYRLNNLSVKAWMSLSRDCPARMSDMLSITYEQIQQGEFLLQSRKENVTGRVYISEETKMFFQQLKRAHIELPKTQRGIDLMIANACEVAGMPQRLNQHLWRKLWISMAINLGIQEVIIKILAFKVVPIEVLTYYLDRENLRDSWKKVVDALPLESAGNGNGRLADLQKKNEEFESVMKILAKYIVEQMQKDRHYKSPPQEIRALQQFLRDKDE